MLFKEGDYIFYGSGGICRIDSITEMPFEGAREGVPYYVLHTLSEPRQVIFNPTVNDKVLMRAVMTKKDTKELLDSLGDLEPFEAQSAKLLREKYIAAIKSGLPAEWVKILVTYEKRRLAAEMHLVRVTEAERGFYTQALSLLAAETALVEGISLIEASALFSQALKRTLQKADEH